MSVQVSQPTKQSHELMLPTVAIIFSKNGLV